MYDERLSKAIARIDAEREAVRTERAAFEEFAEELRALEVPVRRTDVAGAPTLVESTPDTELLQSVRRAYRSTVMAVPEYDEQYGESLRENMAAELDEDVAVAVVDGARFTRPLKSVLLQQIRVAVETRTDLLDALRRERAAIRDASELLERGEDRLEPLTAGGLTSRPFDELVTIERQLRREIDRCEQLLDDRQRDIHRQRWQFPRGDTQLLQEYLYREFDTTYPVVTTALDRIDQLSDNHSTVVRAISRSS